MVFLASLGQSKLPCMFVIEVFVHTWAAGWWKTKHKQPGFNMGYSELQPPKSEVWNWKDIQFLFRAGCE